MKNLTGGAAGPLPNIVTEDELEKRVIALKKHISPEPIPGLSPLLEQRRHVYAVIDEMLRFRATYDRIHVRQLPMEDGTGGKASKDGLIHLPASSQKRALDEAARGIIVSAGLRAMDILVSNSMCVGQLITHIKNAPWRLPVAMIDGKAEQVLVMNVGDIVGNEDLELLIRKGVVEERFDEESLQHYYYDNRTNKRWDPQMPWIPEDN